MYADHHVWPCVRRCWASRSGGEPAVVQHDDAVVSADALGRVLAEAGYRREVPVELEPTLQPSKDGSVVTVSSASRTTHRGRPRNCPASFRR